jgi:hypothetical protein
MNSIKLKNLDNLTISGICFNKISKVSEKIYEELCKSHTEQELESCINFDNQDLLNLNCKNDIIKNLTEQIGKEMPNISSLIDNSIKEKRINKKKVKNGKCVICLDKKSVISFIHGNTGHLICCNECSENFSIYDKCPLCRKNIDNIVKIY